MRFQARQGDVFLRRVDELPSEARRETHKGRYVLAEGEATGHAHILEVETEEDFEVFFSELEVYVALHSPATVRHEEHGTIALDPGIYEVGRQREYTPEEIRRVAD